MRIAERGETVASLFAASRSSLAVSCQRCRHRALVDLTRIDAHEHDHRQVVRLPIICRCGTASIEWVVLETPAEVESFISGGREAATTG